MQKKVTQNLAKQHNKRLILKTIYDTAPLSRADVARATKLTRTTVSNAVSELIGEGLVGESGQAPSGGGKPPTLLEIIPNGRAVIGLDLSGDKLQGSVYDLRGEQLYHATRPFQLIDNNTVLTDVYTLLDELIGHTHAPLLGIGIGTPGLLDAQQGIIKTAVNLGLQDVPLRHLLEERYDRPVYLVNDSQAAALAQYTFDNPQKATDLAVVKVGRGISAGIMLNGQLFQGGNRSGASEIGHVRVVEGGELCTCGHFGCLETVATNRAVLRWAETIAHNSGHNSGHNNGSGRTTQTIDDLITAYHNADKSLNPIIEQVGRYLGISIVHLVTVLNMPHIILAGDLARFGEALITPIANEVNGRILPALAETTHIRLSNLGSDIVMQGAAALLLSHELQVI